MCGLPNQDTVLEDENSFAKIIAVADGVSTCKNSKRGSQIACEAVADILLNETEYIFASREKKIADLLVSFIKSKLKAEAEKSGEDIESYSSTISFVCLNKADGRILKFVLGDSLIYAWDKGELVLACCPDLPESGTYTTTTEDADECVDVSFARAEDHSQLIVCSDGAWSSFYRCGMMKQEAVQAAAESRLHEFLEEQDCPDDCSCAVMSGM